MSCTGLLDYKTTNTPFETNVKLSSREKTILDDSTVYRQLIGSLIYLTVTKPNIAYVIHIVSQFMAAPHTTYFVIVLRVLRYIKSTLLHGLHFSTQLHLFCVHILLPIGQKIT